MSQATENAPSRTQVLGDELRSKVLITARTIKTVELLSQLIWLGILFLFAVFSVVLFEHWVMPLGVWLRLAVWALLVVTGAYVFVRRILPLAMRSIHPAYAARQIEQSMPEMKNSLISWLELAQQNDYVPKGILASVGRYAQRSLVGKDVNSLVDQATVIRMGAILVGLLLVGSTYLAVSPKSGLDSVRRILFPWAKIAAPTRVKILNVQPGDTMVIQGQNLPIHADVQGIRVGEAVSIRFETSDGQLVDQRVRMDMEIERLSYQIDFGANFGGIHQPMRYWVEAGDASAGPYQIAVRAVPLVAVEEVRYDFPPYTKLMPRIVAGDGRIDAVEGTVLSIRASANQTMKQARLEITRNVEGGQFLTATRLGEFDVDDRTITGKWLLELDEKKSNPTRYLYRVRALNEMGSWNEQPIAYPMKVTADIPPEVQIISPLASPIPLPINEALSLQVRAIDPDFGLRKLEMVLKKGDGELGTQELAFHDEGVLGQNSKDFVLQPADWQLKEGDLIEIHAIAEDNRHQPGTNELQPNRSVSTTLQIKIEPPTSKLEDAGSNSKKGESPNDKGEPTNEKKQVDKKNEQGESNTESGSQDDATSGEKGNGSNKRESHVDAKNDKDQNGNQSDNSSAKSDSKAPSDSSNSSGQNDGQNASSKSDDRNQSSKNSAKQSGDKNSANQGDSNQKNAGHSGADQSSSNQESSNQNRSNQNDNNQNGSNQTGETQTNSSPTQAGRDGDRRTDSTGRKPEHDGDVIEEVERFMEEQQKGTQSDSKSETSSAKQKEENSANSASEESKNEESKSDQSNQVQRQGNSAKEPAKGQRSGNEPNNDQSSQSERSDSEQSQKQQPSNNQPEGGKFGSENSATESSKADRSKGEPSDGELNNGDQNESDQSKSDQAKGGQSKSDQAKSDQSKRDQAEGDQSKGDHSKGENSSGDQSKGNQSNSDQAKGDPTTTEQPTSQPTKGDQSIGDPPKGDQEDRERSKGDQTSGEQSKGGQADDTQTQRNQSKGEPSNRDPAGDQANSDQMKNGEGASDPSTEFGAGKNQSSSKQADDKSSSRKSGSEQNSENGNSDAGSAESESASQKGKEGNQSGDSKQEPEVSGSSERPSDSGDGQQQAGPSSGQQSGAGDQKGNGNKQSQSNNRGQNPGGAKQAPSDGQSRQEPQVSDGSSPDQADPANLDYARKTTDLVLDYLDRQRDQPDPKLLERLNWTPEDLRAFVDRWRKAKQDAELDPNKRKEFEESLKSLGLVPKTFVKRNKGQDDQMRGMQEEGNRVLPPESLREQFDAFRRALQENADRASK